MKHFTGSLFIAIILLCVGCNSNNPTTPRHNSSISIDNTSVNFYRSIEDKDNNQYQSKEENIETSFEYEIQYDYVQCPLCNGSGFCGGCTGLRQVYISGEYVDCSACNASGRCGLCEGNGSIKQVKGFH